MTNKIKAYIATVQLLLPGDMESTAEACDAASAALSENLMLSGAILDWSYLPLPDGVRAPFDEGRCADPVQVEIPNPWEADGDLSALNPLALQHTGALVAALERIARMGPDDEPEDEDYDDTESAYNNGHDVAAYKAASIASNGLLHHPGHIRAAMDCSTSHVSPALREWLTAKGLESCQADREVGNWVAMYPFGWFIHASHAASKEDPMPPDLAPIIAKARSIGCDFVIFDRDGPDYDDLPKFDW